MEWGWHTISDMNRIITLIAILFLGGAVLSAQDFNTYRRQQQAAFQRYQQKTQEEWDAYRKKANEEFAEFLAKPWKSQAGEKPVHVPDKVPDVPPVVLPDIDTEIPLDNPIDVDINFPKLDDKPVPIAPLVYKPKPEEKSIAFTFYGTPGKVRFDMSKRASLRVLDEKAVSRFWKYLSGGAYDNIVADCQAIQQKRDLCDWAYLKMTQKVAETIYESWNEQVVFHSWILSQSGYNIRLGRENGKIHLLIGTSVVLFGKSYWKLKEGNFTLLDDDSISSMSIMDASFPNAMLFRMRMKARNAFDAAPTLSRELLSRAYPFVKVTVSCDRNLLAFLQDMPTPALEKTKNADYLMYAQMSLSDNAGKGMYTTLERHIRGKSEAEAANILLNFVQTAFAYRTDGEVWGKERVFFPEETLYYPYCDCEDRAILFCHLVKKLMGLDVAFVSYPGHLATAVRFTENVSGDYFIISGKKYVICDPTFINASIGRTMPGMVDKNAEVFVMD